MILRGIKMLNKLLYCLEKKPTKSTILNIIIFAITFALLTPLTLKAIDVRLLKLWAVFLIISTVVGIVIGIIKEFKDNN